MLTEHQNPVRKRTLKKVHTQFLRRRQEDEDHEIDPDTRFLSNEGNVFRLGSSLVLVEENRKLRVGPEYLNSGFQISDFLVQNGPLNKVASMNLQAGGHEQYISWEYAAKRLRSYGDLDLATWADRIDNFYKIFDKVLRDFDKSRNESTLSSEDFWDQFRVQSQKACNKIEKKYDKFYRVDYRSKRDEITIIGNSFSEGLYKALGYTNESFVEFVEKNGMPGVFEGDSIIYFNCVKYLLALAGFMGDIVYQFPEEKPKLLLRDGSKRRATAHAFHVFEPTPKGFVSHYYYVITKIDTNACEDPENDFHQMYSKCNKGIQALTLS